MSNHINLYQKTPHHWNDRNMSKKDFDYLLELKNKILKFSVF